MECNEEEVVREEDGASKSSILDSKYYCHDKETLIKLLTIRDELLLQKTQDLHQLLEEIKRLKECNEYLSGEVTKLSSELNTYEGHKNPSEETLNQKNKKADENSQDDITEENGFKPMPDWTSTSNNNDSALSICDAVRATAEAELHNMEPKNANVAPSTDVETSPEYVFDSTSGFYYHPSTGYYWDPNSGLFYDYTSGVYYHYNESSGEYEVHSQVDVNSSYATSKETKKQKRLISTLNKSSYAKTISSLKGKGLGRKTKILSKKAKGKSARLTTVQKDGDKQVKLENKNVENEMIRTAADEVYSTDDDSGSLATDESELLSDPESGEIISSSDSSDVELIEEEMPLNDRSAVSANVYTSEQELYPEAMTENYPPCIRAVVEESEKLCIGTLFIITCAGGSVGRDTTANHCITIPDIGVSKNHASIEYDYDDSCYKVKDLGSQNGTKVNDKKLSQESSKHCLSHGDKLLLGISTKLLLHIHKGHDTCEECEPGQIQARIKAHNSIKNTHVVLSKEERKQQQKKELKKIKKKYGLQNSYFETTGAVSNNASYTDKAYLRRKFIGSENENITPNTCPTSVHCPIASSNKGHKMLEKMGWKEGQGLGKGNTGIAEPINVELRVNQSSGLGSEAGHSLSLDQVQDSDKAKRWSQARQRFDKLQQTKPNLLEEGSTAISTNSPNVKDTCTNLTITSDALTSSSSASSQLSKQKIVAKPQITWHKGDSEHLFTSQTNNKIS